MITDGDFLCVDPKPFSVNINEPKPIFLQAKSYGGVRGVKLPCGSGGTGKYIRELHAFPKRTRGTH
jgi:hypothetical protein